MSRNEFEFCAPSWLGRASIAPIATCAPVSARGEWRGGGGRCTP